MILLEFLDVSRQDKVLLKLHNNKCVEECDLAIKNATEIRNDVEKHAVVVSRTIFFMSIYMKRSGNCSTHSQRAASFRKLLTLAFLREPFPEIK